MTGDPTGPPAFGSSAIGGRRALDDRELGALAGGDRVLVRRHLPASVDRDSRVQEWVVEVVEMLRWPGRDGWSLVPGGSVPPHPLDFHIGATGDGVLTGVYRIDPPLRPRAR